MNWNSGSSSYVGARIIPAIAGGLNSLTNPIRDIPNTIMNIANWRAANRVSNFTYSAPAYQSLLNPNQEIRINPFNFHGDLLTVNGRGILSLLRAILNPWTLINELERWHVVFDYKALVQKKWSKIFSWIRDPTIREKLEYFIEAILCIAKRMLSTFPKLARIALIIGVPVAITLFLTWILSTSDYARFTGPLGPQTQPKRAEEELELKYKGKELKLEAEAIRKDLVPCPKCRNTLKTCICKGIVNKGRAEMVSNIVARRKLALKVAKKKEEFLVNDLISPLEVGDYFEVKINTNLLCRLLHKTTPIKVTVLWTVLQDYVIQDTRPMAEKHITLGNARYLILRQVSVQIKYKTFFKNFKYQVGGKNPGGVLALLGLPPRDLIISEEHARLIRHGSVLGKYPESLKGRLETNLSVPLNDPYFKALEAHPLRDALFINRSLLASHETPPSYEDF